MNKYNKALILFTFLSLFPMHGMQLATLPQKKYINEIKKPHQTRGVCQKKPIDYKTANHITHQYLNTFVDCSFNENAQKFINLQPAVQNNILLKCKSSTELLIRISLLSHDVQHEIIFTLFGITPNSSKKDIEFVQNLFATYSIKELLTLYKEKKTQAHYFPIYLINKMETIRMLPTINQSVRRLCAKKESDNVLSRISKSLPYYEKQDWDWKELPLSTHLRISSTQARYLSEQEVIIYNNEITINNGKSMEKEIFDKEIINLPEDLRNNDGLKDQTLNINPSAEEVNFKDELYANIKFFSSCLIIPCCPNIGILCAGFGSLAFFTQYKIKRTALQKRIIVSEIGTKDPY